VLESNFTEKGNIFKASMYLLTSVFLIRKWTICYRVSEGSLKLMIVTLNLKEKN
jgi:hypothetical protein